MKGEHEASSKPVQSKCLQRPGTSRKAHAGGKRRKEGKTLSAGLERWTRRSSQTGPRAKRGRAVPRERAYDQMAEVKNKVVQAQQRWKKKSVEQGHRRGW